jgi:hypothetical protein
VYVADRRIRRLNSFGYRKIVGYPSLRTAVGRIVFRK